MVMATVTLSSFLSEEKKSEREKEKRSGEEEIRGQEGKSASGEKSFKK